jgi:hypothetical protein
VDLHIRIDQEDLDRLDRLVVAFRAYYERQPMPAAKRLAKETTRSSALRDLLLAWEHGIVGEISTDLTKPTSD